MMKDDVDAPLKLASFLGVSLYTDHDLHVGRTSGSQCAGCVSKGLVGGGRKHIQQHRAGLQQGNSVLEP